MPLTRFFCFQVLKSFWGLRIAMKTEISAIFVQIVDFRSVEPSEKKNCKKVKINVSCSWKWCCFFTFCNYFWKMHARSFRILIEKVKFPVNDFISITSNTKRIQLQPDLHRCTDFSELNLHCVGTKRIQLQPDLHHSLDFIGTKRI